MGSITNLGLINLLKSLRTAVENEGGIIFTEGNKRTLDHIQYNAVTDKVESDRAIETTLNSLYLGHQHKMSSGSENIYYTNLTSGDNWYPLMGGIKDHTNIANRATDDVGLYSPQGRVFGAYNTISLGGDPNPSTHIHYDGDNFFPFNISGMGISTVVTEVVPAHIRLKYELSVNGTPVYEQILEHDGLVVNETLSWFFDHPLDIVGTPTTYNHASIRKIDTKEQDLGLLLVAEGLVADDDGNIRYHTQVHHRLFQDKLVAFSDDLEALDIIGYYDLYVDPTYFGTSNGSNLRPYQSLAVAIASSKPLDRIFVKGENNITAEIPLFHSLSLYGIDGTTIKFSSYVSTNLNIFKFVGYQPPDNTVKFIFNKILFMNAGKYALNITGGAAAVDIIDCGFVNNGWNGTTLNTVLPATTNVFGYDSTPGELQGFYASTSVSDGGAMNLENITNIQIIGNRVLQNMRGIKIVDCGIDGNGFITRNVSAKNIDSGIYLGLGALSGCENITVLMNFSAYNANNGILVTGGINNKFSQNEVNGNWNGGFCAWSVANTTLRDCGLYDNNRSGYSGIGNVSDAKASIQINENFSYLDNPVSLNSAARFICEVLDTQVHFTGLGSNIEKIGILISAEVGLLPDNDTNIIKIDDVGFIGQYYAIDLSEVNVSNLRLSLGDNSYQSIGSKAVKVASTTGNYSELPFSNHVMAVPVLDIELDTLKQMISLCEGVGGKVINTYKQHELIAVVSGVGSDAKCDILQANSNKIQLRGLTWGNVYIKGLVTGTDLGSMILNMNGAFSMNLVDYKTFLVSEVGINGDETHGGSLPTIANNWYFSYGINQTEQVLINPVSSYTADRMPIYNGEALEKGHEFIWTHNTTQDYMIGIYGGPEVASDMNSGPNTPGNWTVGFKYYANSDNRYWKGADGSNTTIEQGGSVVNQYYINSGQMALRFGNDGYLSLYEVVANGSLTLIGRSVSQQAGDSVMIQMATYLNGGIPIFTERTETWEFVADYDSSEGGEWANGIEDNSVIKSRVTVSPGFKITIDMSHPGENQGLGFGYTGTSTGESGARGFITSNLIYQTSEVIRGNVPTDWVWNTASSYYVTTSGGGYQLGVGVNLGLISWRYGSDYSLEMWHEGNNELMATKSTPLDGSEFNVYLGASGGGAPNIPALNKYEIASIETLSNLQEWWFIESPDGVFYYPLFKTIAEANAIDSKEGGLGTSHPHTFQDDPTGTTWYMNTINSVHNGTAPPQGGVYGTSTNVIWNEQATGADSGFQPTFNNISHIAREKTYMTIQYKPPGDTNNYTITGLPNGYGDNGSSISATTEDITNGYGFSISHTINVTKTNPFGGTSGSIHITVLANLDSNEFTIIDKEDGNIKFTQDGGLTELDFSSVTFAAGLTYKFYMDGSSIYNGDGLSIVDSSGNTVSVADGSTMNGSAGSTGSYLQYVIPSDVIPGKFLRFYDLALNTSYTDVPIIFSGSTYGQIVTGILNEGPEDSLIVADDNWISINEQLSPGQRLTFSGAFFTNAFNAMKDQQTLCFGIKDGAWDNSQDGNTSSNSGFEYDLCIKFFKSGAFASLNVIKGGSNVCTQYVLIPSFLPDTSAFIEITSNGNNIRIGIDYDTHDVQTTTYLDWTNVEKYDSGDQGYAFTNIDVMMFLDNSTNSVDFNYDDIDWSALIKVSIPATTAALTTSYTKALYLSTPAEHTQQRHMGASWNRLGRGNGTVYYPNADTTKNAVGDCYPYMMSIVCKTEKITLGGSNYGKIKVAQMLDLRQDNVQLKSKQWYIDGEGYMFWRMSDTGGRYVELTSTSQVTTGDEWLGLYHDFSGATIGWGNSTAAERLEVYRFFQTDLVTGVATRIAMTETFWHGSFDHAEIDNTYMNATKGGNPRSKASLTLNGTIGAITIASSVTALTYSSSIQAGVMTAYGYRPLEAEIAVCTRDPLQWEIDYREGKHYRMPHIALDASRTYSMANPVINYQAASTAIFLYGDTSNASSFQDDTNYIRNNADLTNAIFCDSPENIDMTEYISVNITGLS